MSLASILALTHLALLMPLAILGLHKGWMILLYLRSRRRGNVGAIGKEKERQKGNENGKLPHVTIQLPVYNERYVVERLIRSVGAMDYPTDKLEIQVLDDSTDDTSVIIGKCIASLPPELDIQHIRRGERTGYKAGALEYGLARAKGEFLAVFDADFLPPREFLERTIPQFQDPEVGMVQARWGHTNRSMSLLTRMQALLLDGHFAIEQVARSRSSCFFNFNGTAGVFRRSCIEDAGGWQHDTLTEDMDLSYRAQLNGWRFIYLPELRCPAELPADMNGFLIQQHRWAKGSVQTGVKLMRRIFEARIPLLTKLESIFHLYGNFAFPLLLGLILVAMPLQWTRLASDSPVRPLFSFLEGLPLWLATLSVLLYYGLSQLALRRLGPHTFLQLPLVLALGAGLAVNNSAAVFSALRQRGGEFIRTPKYNLCGRQRDASWPALFQYHSPRGLMPLYEVGLGLWSLATCLLSLLLHQHAMALFHGLFASGLLWVGLRSLRANLRSRRAAVANLDAQYQAVG